MADVDDDPATQTSRAFEPGEGGGGPGQGGYIDLNDQEDDGTIDLTGVDVWASDFDPTSVFEPEMLEEVTSFFIKASPSGVLTLEELLEWEELPYLYADGLTQGALKGLWDQAVASKPAAAGINLDAFMRLNVALDLLMDELEANPAPPAAAAAAAGKSKPAAAAASAAVAAASDAEAAKFYRSEFRSATGGGRLMRLDMLLEWPEMAELVRDGVVTERQLERLWETLPKEPMGIPVTSYGISEETFVAFNAMLDSMLEVTGAGGGAAAAAGGGAGAGKGTTKAATPQQLVSEPARPMPKMDAELRMGALGTAPGAGAGTVAGEGRSSEDDATTGLSESELELMQVLDKADNMLNSGSFGDFDQLIGDLNDPRLQALREKRDGAAEVRGQINDVLNELLQLAGKQSRCGLDPPDEETSARIRDLIQAVIEKSPRAAQRDINDIRKAVNGKWKLLFTNSEMFSFYNGVTGFANVFPGSKFSDLSTQYSSDGFLSESRYLERLTTPLGSVDATVFATWELVKEMSFMTNDNSVVLRNYCTKVTAGPMEYLAEENWKSLRTMSMNELVYVDDRVKIMRNSGALRIYFVYERQV